MSIKQCAIIGTGSRGCHSFLRGLNAELKGQAELVGLYDINPERARVANQLAGTQVPVFASYDELIAKARPNTLIVTSTDATHAEYVVKGIKAGLDVYSEKPLCTTFEQVQAIRAAAAAPGAGCGRVTHNMRFFSNNRSMKQAIVDGKIGDILQVRFTETLDRFHGADYFRRWHRRMINSGGLALQKASHHFDLVNWFVDSKPAFLSARGRLGYYGKNGPFRGPRCSACEHAAKCPRYADVFANSGQKMLYKDVETVDGYIRDACVFGEEIDIYDTIHAAVTYENGVELSYSLNAYAEYEGAQISVEGTLGCIDQETRTDTGWAVGHKGHATKNSLAADGIGPDTRDSLVFYPAPEIGGERQNITPPTESGGHGGSDPLLRRMLFGQNPPPDPLGMVADLEKGIQAVLIGIAVNESIRLGGCCINVQTMTPVLPPKQG